LESFYKKTLEDRNEMKGRKSKIFFNDLVEYNITQISAEKLNILNTETCEIIKTQNGGKENENQRPRNSECINVIY